MDKMKAALDVFLLRSKCQNQLGKIYYHLGNKVAKRLGVGSRFMFDLDSIRQRSWIPCGSSRLPPSNGGQFEQTHVFQKQNDCLGQ